MSHTCHQFDPANPPQQWVQDGYVTDVLDDGGVVQYPRMVEYRPEWITTTPDGAPFPCQYSNRADDPNCAHCERRKS